MRQLLMLALVLTSGCSLPFVTRTPPGEKYGIELYRHEVQYEVLGQATGEACATKDQIDMIEDVKSPDPRAVGNNWLFEHAKFEALKKIAGADGLLALRVDIAFDKDRQKCTTVTGRAYRIVGIRAVAPPGRLDEERKQQPPPLMPPQP